MGLRDIYENIVNREEKWSDDDDQYLSRLGVDDEEEDNDTIPSITVPIVNRTIPNIEDEVYPWDGGPTSNNFGNTFDTTSHVHSHTHNHTIPAHAHDWSNTDHGLVGSSGYRMAEVERVAVDNGDGSYRLEEVNTPVVHKLPISIHLERQYDNTGMVMNKTVIVYDPTGDRFETMDEVTTFHETYTEDQRVAAIDKKMDAIVTRIYEITRYRGSNHRMGVSDSRVISDFLESMKRAGHIDAFDICHSPDYFGHTVRLRYKDRAKVYDFNW